MVNNTDVIKMIKGYLLEIVKRHKQESEKVVQEVSNKTKETAHTQR